VAAGEYRRRLPYPTRLRLTGRGGRFCG